MLRGIDLPSSFRDGFLSLLLFAGALQLDLENLVSRKWTITALATVGVALSTALLGLGASARRTGFSPARAARP